MTKTGITTFLTLLIVSVTIFAAPQGDKGCGDFLKKIEQSAPLTDTELAAKFKYLDENTNMGWATRGFMGILNGTPELTAPAYVQAIKNGIMWWSFRFVFVNNLEEAIAHNAKIENRLMKGAYIIGSESEIEFKPNTEEISRRPVEGKSLRAAIEKAKGFVTFDMDEKPVHISAQEAFERLSFSSIVRIPSDIYSHDMPVYNHEGWASLKVRGVLDYSIMTGPQAPSAIVKARNLARTLQRSGFRFVYNQNFIESLKMARGQTRNGKPNASRYASDILYNAAVELYKLGLAFSVEVYDPNGKLVGGSINFRIGNLVSGDTVFYTVEDVNYVNTEGKIKSMSPIDIARTADVVTMDYMHALGVDIMDIGMVSHYSETIAGMELERPVYKKTVANLGSNIFAFPKIFDPFQYPDLDFRELAKSPDAKAITKAKFVGGNVLATDYAIAKAKEVGLKPFELKVYVVDSTDAIKAMIAKVGDADVLFYSLNGQHTVMDWNANKVLQKVVREGARQIQELDPTSKNATKLIKPEQIKNVINPHLSSDFITWEDSEFGPRISVKGWALGR